MTWNDVVKKKCHFSLDDTIEIFRDLTENEGVYKSMFENKILAYLRKLHEFYGATVSLYCFYEDGKGFDLHLASDRYAKEFKANGDWIKVGFHGRNGNITYDQTTAQEAKRDYDLVVTELQRICGGPECLTRRVRLSWFQGNTASIEAFRQCDWGITGLFTADDQRQSYDLLPSEEEEIRTKGYRKAGNMEYYHTDIRAERIPDKHFLKHAIYGQDVCVIFTHEYLVLDGRIQKKLERLLLEAVKSGREFSFLE